jgi:hypothetical protein
MSAHVPPDLSIIHNLERNLLVDIRRWKRRKRKRTGEVEGAPLEVRQTGDGEAKAGRAVENRGVPGEGRALNWKARLLRVCFVVQCVSAAVRLYSWAKRGWDVVKDYLPW